MSKELFTFTELKTPISNKQPMIKNHIKAVLLLLLLICLAFGCKSTSSSAYSNQSDGIDMVYNTDKVWDAKAPYVLEEFRAAWIATVANISWPSKPGLSTFEQKKEALELLDFLSTHNYNAVVLQVRPQCDALYQSELEPWSYYLTGEQGIAPSPWYDPLAFWVEEAHKRGLELHAWLNPYRAHHSAAKSITETSIVRKHPELVVELANGMWWMDPALEQTKKHSLAVVEDLVKRYNLDGIHFDDYFYPYDSYNNGKDFPDQKSWNTYLSAGGKMDRGDWRRDHVNDFIKRVYELIKSVKPYVKLGISPFGIWKPGYPASVVGFNQYDKLYADAKLWLNKGWVDYFTPQLYWKTGKIGQSFPELLGWWNSQNSQQRHLWPGIRIDYGGDDLNIQETIGQIMITRGMLPNSKGTVHWSIGPLMKYDSLSSEILNGPYRRKSLIPASPWLDNTPPEQPYFQLTRKDTMAIVTWQPKDIDDIHHYVVYFQYQGRPWDYKILTKYDLNLEIPLTDPDSKSQLLRVGLTGLDRSWNQSLFQQKEL